MPATATGQFSEDVALQIAQDSACPDVLIVGHKQCGDRADIGPLSQKRPVRVERLDALIVPIGQEVADLGAEAARDLPKAERAARILYDATTDLTLGSNDLPDDFLEFDRLTITKVEAGKL